MTTGNHILAKEGILTTFSIAKKVSAKDIKRLRNKLKSSKADAEKFQDLLKTAVMKETQQILQTQNIPGLIINGSEDVEEQKKIMELTYFASIISKKLADKKITKYHSCYIINAIVNMLGLTGEDFDEFHRKFSKFKNGNEGEDIDDTESPLE